MKTKLVKLGIPTLALGLAVLGCSGQPNASENADQANVGDADTQEFAGTTVRVLAEDINYTDNIQELLGDFTEETGIQVQIETAPYADLATKQLLNMSQGSTDYDVFMNDASDGSAFYEADYVEDLREFEPLGASFVEFQDFNQNFMRAVTSSDDAIFGLPVYGESTWLMYRMDIFDEYGIEGPPETLEELRSIAEQITNESAASGDSIAGITLRGQGSAAVYAWSGLLRSFGGDFLNDQGEPALDTPEAIDTTEYYVDLLQNFAPEGVGNFTWELNRIAFTEGKAAMTIDATANGPFNEDEDESEIAGNVGYAPIPYASGVSPEGDNTNNSLNAHAFYVNSASENKEAAYLFMAWATGPEVQIHAVENTEALGVTLTEALESEAFNEKYGVLLEPYLSQLETGNPQYSPTGKRGPKIKDSIAHAFSRALANEVTPKQAMEEAQRDVTQ